MIYFVKVNEYIKIGFSRRPFRRVVSIQHSIPFDTVLLGVVPGDVLTEQLLHDKFKDYRFRGEWFVGIEDGVKEVLALYSKLFPDFDPKNVVYTIDPNEDDSGGSHSTKSNWTGRSLEEKRTALIDWMFDFDTMPTMEDFLRHFNASRRTYYGWVPPLWNELYGEDESE